MCGWVRVWVGVGVLCVCVGRGVDSWVCSVYGYVCVVWVLCVCGCCVGGWVVSMLCVCIQYSILEQLAK